MSQDKYESCSLDLCPNPDKAGFGLKEISEQKSESDYGWSDLTVTPVTLGVPSARTTFPQTQIRHVCPWGLRFLLPRPGEQANLSTGRCQQNPRPVLPKIPGRFSINISNPIPVCGSAECGAGAGDGKNAFTSRVQATGTFKLWDLKPIRKNAANKQSRLQPALCKFLPFLIREVARYRANVDYWR